VPFQTLFDGVVTAIEDLHVVRIHELGNLHVQRAWQAIATSGAEPLEAGGEVRLYLLDVLG
jgi:hypothetical protein